MTTETRSLAVTVDGQQLTFAPGKTVTFGRTLEADVTINHPLVSRNHAVAAVGRDGWVLTDVSTNGVFADGVRRPSVIIDGAGSIQFGDPRTGASVAVELVSPTRPSAKRPMQPPSAPQGPPATSQSAPPPTQRSGSSPASLPGRAVTGRQSATELPPHLQAMAANTGLYQLPSLPSTGSTTGQITIGRTPDNDVVIPDMLVSRRHARLLTGPQNLVLEDLQSANGTQINGQRVTSPTPLREGDVVTVGNSDLVVSNGRLERPRPQQFHGAGLVVHGVTLTVEGKKTLLNGIEFRAAPGTLTAVIGPSGAGKSTVSRVVSGAVNPTVGRIEFEGRDVHRDFDALRSRIGMVPQDDVLHRQLTLQQALRYAAELRLPPDMSRTDRDQVIDGVLAELQLTEHKQTRVDRLSGGQRKRASVAMELLTGPSLLILDEPTSGLDPALDRQVMQTLRRLADAGRVVMVVTHSLTHIGLCDQVLLLAPGGKTSYCGPPKRIRAAMGTSDWAEIFDFVARQPDVAWQRYRSANPAPPPPPPARPAPPATSAPGLSTAKQMSVVARRQLRLILADRGYLIFLLLMPVVLGAITLLVPGELGLAGLAPGETTGGPTMILVLLVVGACFMGAALTARDLVGERPIYHRERAVGLNPGAYLAAKTVVYFGAAVIQVAIMMTIVLAGVQHPATRGAVIGNAAAELVVDIALLACVSTLVGLLVSALAKSSEQVMPLLVVAIMVQLVMSGGLFGLHDRPGLEQVSWLFPARWGFASSASTIDLQRVTSIPDPQNPAVQKVVTPDPLWDATAPTWLLAIGVTVAMMIVLWLLVRARISRTSS